MVGQFVRSTNDRQATLDSADKRMKRLRPSADETIPSCQPESYQPGSSNGSSGAGFEHTGNTQSMQSRIAAGAGSEAAIRYTPAALSAASTRASRNGTRRIRTPVAS